MGIPVYSNYSLDMCNMYSIGKTKIDYKFLVNNQPSGKEQLILPKLSSLGLTGISTTLPNNPTNTVVTFDSCFIHETSDVSCFDYLGTLSTPLPLTCPMNVRLNFVIKNNEKSEKRCENIIN